MRFKHSLKCNKDDRLKIAFVADEIWREMGQELVITSIEDGKHKSGSKHYSGEAIDLRIHYFTDDEKEVAAEALADVLGRDYDVVLEKTHIHVEYDPVPF